MNFVGFKEIALKSIVVDAVDIRRRQALEHVANLADDAEQNGGEYMHPPTVRADGNRLIAGRDRVAGALLKKRKKIWVHVADCTDDEAKALELAENIYRRPLEKDERARALTALVKLREQQHKAEDEAKRAAGEEVSSAPQDSPKARARKEVARAAGITTAAVKKHEQRSEPEPRTLSPAPTRSGTDAGPAEIELPHGFGTFDLPVGDELRASIDSTHGFLSQFESDVRHVLRGLSDIERVGTYTVSAAAIQAIRERAQALGQVVRDALPAGLCFYCKAQPALQPTCAGCGGVGVVGRHAGDNVPRELKSGGVGALVAVNGEFVPLAQADAPPQAKQKNGKSKGIRVEVQDEPGGPMREITVEREEPEEELF